MLQGWTFEYHDLIPTTQDLALERVLENQADRHAVVAYQQTQARGRGGNIWIAPKGNLYTTLIVKPSCEVRDYGLMSFLVAVAIEQSIAFFVHDQSKIQLKWPNDVLVDGKKIAGILLEVANSTEQIKPSLLIGIGVNINSCPQGAICLNECSNKTIDVQEFLNHVLMVYDELDGLAKTQGFSEILKLWTKNAKGIGDKISVRLPQEKLEGVFESLESSGALKLKLSDGSTKLVHSGEVYFGWD